MLNTEQKNVMQVVLDNLFSFAVSYLTGNAGSGKTYTAKQILANLPEDWHGISCSPYGKAADIAGSGITMQSLFKLMGNTVLPDDVSYLRFVNDRALLTEVIGKARKNIARVLGLSNLNSINLFIYIEEVMSASAEDLAAVRMILEGLKELNSFHILAVGHPLQGVMSKAEPFYMEEKLVGHTYQSPAYMPPKWATSPDGYKEGRSFFEFQKDWKVQSLALRTNVRASNKYGEVLDQWAEGKNIVKKIKKVVGKFHTCGEIDPSLYPNATFLTSSLKIEREINATLGDDPNAVPFYPYIEIGEVKGYVTEWDVAKGIKLEGKEGYHKIPSLHAERFFKVLENLPVGLCNYIIPGQRARIRCNSPEYKNGQDVLALDVTKRSVRVKNEKGELLEVTYRISDDIPVVKGNRPFIIKFLPLMSYKAMTTAKEQGQTYETPIVCLVDARARSHKPHSLYVALSRATRGEDVTILVHHFQEGQKAWQVVHSALRIDKDALKFHLTTTNKTMNISDLASVMGPIHTEEGDVIGASTPVEKPVLKTPVEKPVLTTTKTDKTMTTKTDKTDKTMTTKTSTPATTSTDSMVPAVLVGRVNSQLMRALDTQEDLRDRIAELETQLQSANNRAEDAEAKVVKAADAFANLKAKAANVIKAANERADKAEERAAKAEERAAAVEAEAVEACKAAAASIKSADERVAQAEAKADKYLSALNRLNAVFNDVAAEVTTTPVVETEVDEPKVDEPEVDEPKVDEPEVEEVEEDYDFPTTSRSTLLSSVTPEATEEVAEPEVEPEVETEPEAEPEAPEFTFYADKGSDTAFYVEQLIDAGFTRIDDEDNAYVVISRKKAPEGVNNVFCVMLRSGRRDYEAFVNNAYRLA